MMIFEIGHTLASLLVQRGLTTVHQKILDTQQSDNAFNSSWLVNAHEPVL